MSGLPPGATPPVQLDDSNVDSLVWEYPTEWNFVRPLRWASLHRSGIVRFIGLMLLVSFLATNTRGQDPIDALADQIAGAYFESEGETSEQHSPFQLASATMVTQFDPTAREFEQGFGRAPGWFRGRTILQMGISQTRDEFDGIEFTDTVIPDLLLRYQLLQRLEMRVGWAGWNRSQLDDTLLDFSETETTTSDVTIGAALRLWQQRGPLPTTRLLLSVPLESDGNPFALRSLIPTMEVGYAWELNERWSLAGATGLILLDYDEGEDETVARWTQTIALSRWFGDQVSVFGDVSALIGEGEDECSLTGGGFLQMTDRFGLSGFAGVGLNEFAPDSQIGLGWSFSF